MKLDNLQESKNVDDRRGRGGLVRGGQIGGLGLIIVVVASLLFGVDPRQLLESGALPGGTGQTGPSQPYQESAAEAELRERATKVLTSTERVWTDIFAQAGDRYPVPTLVLFSGSTTSACGGAQSAMGPFYCPADKRVYIDLTFFAELSRRFGAPGDFAQAYVVAHEVGHHIQTIMGISGKVSAKRAQASQEEGNALSVRLELQADCFAGVWAKRAEAKDRILEEGDIDEAIGAASAVGDDRLQKAAQGHVVPESFTHGTADQRSKWFRTGFQAGSLDSCDTFSVDP